jgi:hypothetical protein
MGKGPPGGRRQAGSIDYRTEPMRCEEVCPPTQIDHGGARRPPRRARCRRDPPAAALLRPLGRPLLGRGHRAE